MFSAGTESKRFRNLGKDIFAPQFRDGKSPWLNASKLIAGQEDQPVELYDLVTDPGEEGSHRERKQNFTPDNLRKELEHSLKIMGVTNVDILANDLILI